MTALLQNSEPTVRYRLLPFIAGIVFIALGPYVLIVPIETYLILVPVFSTTFVVLRATDTYFAVSNRREMKEWAWKPISGISGVLIGTYLPITPILGMMLLSFMIGIWNIQP
ncbi:DUF308 domain-containing protein [Muricauda sp. 334s03]|jgi:uncharacterized membrane protein HdeD (DUF308 family)|uniref:DUF308 domain-containing protein n=2 Tax=Flagellimonas TaxID=444459 RepID=A0ABT5XNH5_9FLAO|nr:MULTISPECIES: DUF308 domain-containing protein [Allomuricauda]MDF0707451.1 DUF308 domain-containing protein [[Muricauda] okinawensis]MDF0715352.1 DUF308 domain-containing protein [[Muricauda] yonaguniensis]